jgi:DNA-directed RNA polymerase subunit RPC12/RpoP
VSFASQYFTKKEHTGLSCPKCGSGYIRPAHRRRAEWWLVPFMMAYRCRECRHRFIRVRVINRLIDSY